MIRSADERLADYLSHLDRVQPLIGTGMCQCRPLITPPSVH
jgi:hypothetical protein